MCFATAALITGLAGTAVSAYGQYEGGQANAEMANYQSEVARHNQIIAQQNAVYAIQAGEQKATDTSLQEAQTLGRIKAAQAASGVDANTGSNRAVQVSQREIGALDTATVLNNAQLQAYGYRSQAKGFAAEAGLQQMAAAQDITGADIGAAGTLLGGASGAGFKWSQVGGSGGGGSAPTTGWDATVAPG